MVVTFHLLAEGAIYIIGKEYFVEMFFNRKRNWHAFTHTFVYTSIILNKLIMMNVTNIFCHGKFLSYENRSIDVCDSTQVRDYLFVSYTKLQLFFIFYIERKKFDKQAVTACT